MKKIYSIFLLGSSFSFAFFETVNSFEANFVQRVDSDGTEIIYKGRLIVEKPSKALWQYREPVKKDIFINDQQVLVIEPELQQVTIRKNQRGLQITDLLSKSKKVEENRYVADIEGKKYLLLLKDGKLNRIIYEDEMENGVEITLSNVIENSKIDKNIFIPQIPASFDKIYQ